MLRLLLLCFAAISIPLTLSANIKNRIEDKCSLAILTPSLAKRASSKIVLENALEIYLISDPETHESGAALSVEVGSYYDPDKRPGMAHFVEHMLFMGTEKFPEEEGYHKFLNEHGGKCNAFTAEDRTVYGFICHNEHYLEGLDRFAQFFIAPLLSSSSLQREACAIDQEFCKDLPLDAWRIHHVKKELSHAEHPFHRFCIGNKKTLQDVTSQELRSWYEGHYSSDRMHLVIYSHLPLETLERDVVSYFSALPKRPTPTISYDSPLFPSELNKQVLLVSPLQDIHLLELTWELPATFGQEHYSHADELVGFVLGHEGEDSLYSQLKKAHLIEGLSAGKDSYGKDKLLFTITCKLTKKGVANYAEVAKSCFEAIDHYTKAGVPSYLFDEVSTMKKMRYAYQSREDLFSNLMEFASALTVEPLESFPELTLTPTRYLPEKMDELFQHLKMDNCFLTLATDPALLKVKLDKKEPWMEVEYTLLPLPTELAGKEVTTDSSLALPKPNPFIPKNLKLLNANDLSKEVLPKAELISDTPRQQFYFAPDRKILVPEISWVLNFRTPLVRGDQAATQVVANLYTYVINKQLNPTLFEAGLAGLNCSFTTSDNGLKLRVYGYSEKALPFLKTILKEMVAFVPIEKDFTLAKEYYKEEYDNKLNKTPITQAADLANTLIYQNHPSWGNKQKALSSLSYGQFLEFSNELFKKGYVEGMLYGNLSREEALQVAHLFEEKMECVAYPRNDHFHKAVSTLGDKGPSYFVKKSKHPANVVILYLDGGDFSFEKKAALDILTKSLEEPFFSELRTKQQTGYVVTSWSDEIERRLFAFFLTQSSSHDPRDLIARFELFFESSLTHLEAEMIPEERFESVRASLILSLEHPSENMEKMGDLLHEIAYDYEGDFEWQEKEIAALKNLTYPEFKEFSAAFLGKENKKRLAVCVEGSIPERTVLSYRKLTSFQKMKEQISYREKISPSQPN